MPIILVGLKEDLRTDQRTLDVLKAEGKVPVTEQQASQLKKELGAAHHIVCSSKTQKNVKEVFELAVGCALAPKKKRGCGSN